MNSHPLHLCAGIFFTLLVDCRRPVSSYKDTWDAESELTNVDISDKLIRLVLDDFPPSNANTVKTHVSRMLNCVREKLGVSTPFYSDEYRETLQSDISNDYSSVLSHWDQLLHEVIGVDRQIMYQRFADRLLTVIDADENFDGYHDPIEGRYISKAELSLGHPIISFQSFTLGVWDWICENAPSNLIDNEIMEHWRKENPTLHARFRILTENEIQNAAPSTAETEEETPAEEISDHRPITQSQNTGTVIVNGNLYQQKAERIVNIEHVDHLEI